MYIYKSKVADQDGCLYKVLNALKLPVNIYTLFNGFTDNTRGYFTSCVVFFQAPQGRGKMQATSKMSASIICNTIE